MRPTGAAAPSDDGRGVGFGPSPGGSPSGSRPLSPDGSHLSPMSQEAGLHFSLLHWRRLPTPGWSGRCAASALVLGNGSVLLMGGYDGSHFLNEIWRSSDSGASWQRQQDPPWSPRLRAAAVAVPMSASDPNSRASILLLGGETEDRQISNELWLSEDEGRSWRQLPSPPWPARCGARALLLPEERGVILMGGWGAGDMHLKDCWTLTWAKDLEGGSLRSLDNGTWTERPQPKWSAREDMSAVVLSNGALMVFGGFGEDGKALGDLYVSLNCGESWDKLKNPTISARGSAVAALGPGGCPMLLGGTDNESSILKEAWDAEPHGVKWRSLPLPPWPGRSGAAAVTMPNGKVLLLGGMSEKEHTLQDAWVFEQKDAQSPSEKQREKLRLVGAAYIERTVEALDVSVCSQRLVQEIDQHDMQRLADNAQLRIQLWRKLEAALSYDHKVGGGGSHEESISLFVSDVASMSVLLLEATKRHTTTARSCTLTLSGKIFYVEAINKDGFQVLRALAESHALSAALEGAPAPVGHFT